ncbi:hypothetical protein ACFVAJ_18695 [Agromyces sp. NPDC057679]|uniref:hypothetical protein n=1 Tax=Agromyces sp. NPDC057679 TaxID=3346207 RepID=UPI00366E1C30
MNTPSTPGGRLSPEDLAALEARRDTSGRFGTAHHTAAEVTLEPVSTSVPQPTPAGVGWFDDEGRLHREDGPALDTDIAQSWYDRGTLLRKELEDGTTVHFDDEGLPHSDEGPAILFGDGEAQYIVHGELIQIQRPDGSFETLGSATA